MARATKPTNKDLLELETERSTSSSLESTLLVCKKKPLNEISRPQSTDGKLVTTSVPKSGVLGKVKDFLGAMEESNKRLLHDAKQNSDNYDIEVLTGNETEYIEMDLLLGVADLHTPEAVAAAEFAISNSNPVVHLAAASSDSDTVDSDDENDSSSNTDGDDDDDNDDDDDDNKNNGSHSLHKFRKSNSSGKVKAEKRPKIQEL